MHGTSLFLAEIAIPSAWQCLVFAAPLLVVAGLWWLIERADHAANHLFPDWEWEKRLGWLNFRAQRRADLVMRWIGYLIYALLAAALYGIVWGAQALAAIDRWSDSDVMGDLALRVPVLLVSLGFWLIYLGLELIPKLRDQHEREELEKYRVEQEKIEREKEKNSPSRLKSSQPQPKFTLPARSDRMRPRR